MMGWTLARFFNGLAMGQGWIVKSHRRVRRVREVETTTIAIDLAKNAFAVCGANVAGELAWHKELRRAQLLSFMRRQRPCVVGMEACSGAHYWAPVCRHGSRDPSGESRISDAISEG